MNVKCATRNLPCQYIGETKRHLHERFGEHRRSVQNHQQLANPTVEQYQQRTANENAARVRRI